MEKIDNIFPSDNMDTDENPLPQSSGFDFT
jgi:hypothetical protein